MYGLSTVWGRGAWDVGRRAWGVAYAGRTHQSEILFSQLTRQGGKGKFRSQFIIYDHLNRGLREQGESSPVERQDKTKERKGKEEKHREICPAMLQGFQCCKRLSERPGKLMDVQSFSGTKNK